MKQLEPSDIYYLKAADGWRGLGDLDSANAELDRIAPQFQSHPDVLSLRSDILTNAKNWDTLLTHAKAELELVPHLPHGFLDGSYALYYMERFQEAYDFLLPAAKKFQWSSLVAFNLANYSLPLGRRKEAWQWLMWAFELDPGWIKYRAVGDPDLKDFWADLLNRKGFGNDGTALGAPPAPSWLKTAGVSRGLK